MRGAGVRGDLGGADREACRRLLEAIDGADDPLGALLAIFAAGEADHLPELASVLAATLSSQS